MAKAQCLIPILDSEQDKWAIEIEVMLECVKDEKVRTHSISKVPDSLRKNKNEAYSPKIVSIGPFHWGIRTDLQVREQMKWRYMHELLDRSTAKGEGRKYQLKSCTETIRGLYLVVRATYVGDIKLNQEELARIMLLDGCFILELLLKLYDHVNEGLPYPADVEDKTLSDLTMLENQIPFIVLEKLLQELSQGNPRYRFPQFDELAKSLFDYHIDADSSDKVFHFLHLMYKSSTYNCNEADCNKIAKKAKQELKRCTRELRASGIDIQAGAPVTSNIGLSHIVDKFDLNIEFDKSTRTLTIPQLRIKKGTEVKWRNLIALEQSGIEKDYKFTTYALFFNGLICSVDDIELLKAKNIVEVDNDTKMKKEDLLAMFKTILNGVQKMDSRYSELCKSLNAAVDCVRFLRPRLWWHYWRRVLPWLHEHFQKWILDFKKDYMHNPWVFMGVIAATVLLGLTIAQTVFAAIGLRH